MRLSDCLDAVRSVDRIEGLRDLVVRFARQLGFDTVCAKVVVDRSDGADFYCVGNTPESYRPIFENDTRSRRGPVSSTASRIRRRLFGTRARTCRPGVEISGKSRPGTAIAVVSPWPSTCRQAGTSWWVSTAAKPTQATVCQLRRGGGDSIAGSGAGLWRRFAWRSVVARARSAPVDDGGKTAWEIGRILAISEQTVVRHLGHAAHKLTCVNKVQAVAKALRLGLIR